MAVVVLWTGLEAKALRLTNRLTIETFAERLGAGVRTVANWESRGSSITPQPDMQAALDTLLERGSADARSRFSVLLGNLRRQQHEQAVTGSAQPPRREGGGSPRRSLDGSATRLAGRKEAAGGGELSRVPFLPAVLERTALDWLLEARSADAPGIATTEAACSAGADAGYAEDAAIALQMFRQVDHAQGSGHVHGEVDQYIADHISPMIDGDAVPRGDTVGRHSLAAGFFEFSGYQAVDIGADGVAQRRYLRALQLAQGVRDRDYGAYLLAVSLGHLALHCNHPETALRAAMAAVASSGDAASPAVQAALHAVVARAQARLGHVRECTAELVTAEARLERSDPAGEPVWIRYFTPAYLADEMAHCFFDLGDHLQAQRAIGSALTSLQPGHLRRLTIDTALLASSLSAQGHVDGACAVGRAAVDHAAATASQRCIQRIVGLRLELETHRDQRDVREFIDYLHNVLPSAA